MQINEELMGLYANGKIDAWAVTEPEEKPGDFAGMAERNGKRVTIQSEGGKATVAGREVTEETFVTELLAELEAES